MVRTKQTKKVKPSSPDSRKFLNKSSSKAIVKAKHKSAKRRAASVLASSHKDKKIGLFLEQDMQDAMDLYRQSRLPGFQGKPLSIRDVCERFKSKKISFGSLQKRLSGEVTTIGPASGGKGKPRLLPRDVEGKNTLHKTRSFCLFLEKTKQSGFP